MASWYGQWWVGGRRVTRALGRKREPGTRLGLTRAQAERELQRLIDRDLSVPLQREFTVREAGERLIDHLDALGRKRSTLGDYESFLRVHLAPYFGETVLERIGRAEVEGFVAAKRREGKATKSVLNYLGLLHSIFAYAERRGLARGNPVKLVDKPRAGGADPDIRFLDEAELDALIAAVPDDARGPMERSLYIGAAMTGLRQGELLGLRWRDIDWSAGRVRVRQSYVRGEFGTPKSKRSSRSVPLADRSRGSSTATSSEAPTSKTTTWSSAIPRTESRSIAQGSPSASRRRRGGPASATFASTTSATPSEHGWRAPGCRFAPCRSGWATAISRPP